DRDELRRFDRRITQEFECEGFARRKIGLAIKPLTIDIALEDETLATRFDRVEARRRRTRQTPAARHRARDALDPRRRPATARNHGSGATLTMRLPMLSPASKPTKARGAWSSPSTTSSST